MSVKHGCWKAVMRQPLEYGMELAVLRDVSRKFPGAVSGGENPSAQLIDPASGGAWSQKPVMIIDQPGEDLRVRRGLKRSRDSAPEALADIHLEAHRIEPVGQ